jgi:hypothetical protein
MLPEILRRRRDSTAQGTKLRNNALYELPSSGIIQLPLIIFELT